MKPLNLNKPHLLIMVGIPGSGKSFFAEHFSETFKAPFISSDRLRADLFNSPDYSKNEESIISRIENYMTEEALKTSQTIIYEGLTDTKAERAILAKKAKDAGYEPLLIWVQTEPIGAKKRSIKSASNKTGMTAEQWAEKSKRFVNPGQLEKFVVISGKHTYISQLKIVLKNLIKTQSQPQPTVPINPTRPQVGRNILIR
jgi:predicted kinase